MDIVLKTNSNSEVHLDNKSADIFGINEEGDFEALWTIGENMIMVKFHHLNNPKLEVTIFKEDDPMDTIMGLRDYLLSNDYQIKGWINE